VGRGVGYLAGGILGLHRLLAEHGEAIRFDLFMAGRSLDDLGSSGFSWLDLLAYTRHAPHTSALARAVHGEAAAWGATEHLLANVIDLLAIANWQRGGKKAGPRPKPIQRPGARKRIGTTVLPLDALDKLLGYSPRT